MASRNSKFVETPIQTPFTLDWVIGFNSRVPILNLTTSARFCTVAAATAHIVSIYSSSISSRSHSDTEAARSTTTVQHLVGGHETSVHSLDSNSDGRFLLTASNDACVVWDRQNVQHGAPIALRQISQPFGEGGSIDKAIISQDAKYILLAGFHHHNPVEMIQFWIWSAGRDVPDAQLAVPNETLGPVLTMTFNPYDVVTTEFALTMKQNVLFGQWSPDKTPAMSVFTPKVMMSKPGFTMTTFCETSRQAVTVSDFGTCTLWSRPFGSMHYAVVKAMRIGRVPLKWTHYIDEMVVVLDAQGRLRFFDENLRIIFAGEEGYRVDIANVCFDLMGRRYRLADPHEFDSNSVRNQTLAASTGVAGDDGEPEPELLYHALVPKCTTVDANPFIVRNCVAVDKLGRVLRCDLVQRTADRLCIDESSRSIITTFDVHLQRNLVCAGCSDGQVFTYDFVQRERVFQRQLPTMDGTYHAITFLMFTKLGTQLIVSMEPGEVCIVDVIVLELVGRPIHPSEGVVTRACTSESGELIAYCDNDHTTVLIRMVVTQESTDLQLIGKHRSHSEAISCLVFMGPDDGRLLTFSEDRYLSEYDVKQSIAAEELIMIRRFRYESSAKVLSAVWLGGGSTDCSGAPELLTCGSEFKLKTWHLDTLSITRTVVGPLLDGYPLRSLCPIPQLNADDKQSFMAFCTNGRTLGLQLLPFDGNAFRHVGMLAHPKSIRKMFALPDGKTLFTLGEKGAAIFVWNIQRQVVLDNFKRGGEGLMPFVLALPGGRQGWLFREMQDMFYYMQILSNSQDCPEEQTVSDSIPLSDVPDYLRGLGVFLGEFEESSLVMELSANRPQMARHIGVMFGELLKVYVNHRPAQGYQIEQIKHAMAYFSTPLAHRSDSKLRKSSRKSSNWFKEGEKTYMLDRERLMEVCCNMGEKMGRVQAARYLVALLANAEDELTVEDIMEGGGDEPANVSDEEEATERLLFNAPEVFNVQDFLEDVFGLDSTGTAAENYGFSFLHMRHDDPGQVNEVFQNTPKVDVNDTTLSD